MLVIVLAMVVAILDQLTKQVIRSTYYLGESHVVVDGFFNLTYVRNTGAAWGILGGQNAWLTLLSAIMLIVIFVFRRSFLTDSWEHRLALGLMVGGIMGNLYDRVRLGWVTDFLDFHWHGYHWPAFNIADSGICVGVTIYLVSSLWLHRHPMHTPNSPTEKTKEVS